MQKSLYRLLLFLVPILIAWGGLEYFYRAVPNNYTVKRDYLQNHADEIEVLLFGSSHYLYGLNPDYFSKHTFNLSNVSQTIYFDHLLFKRYIESLPRLKKVVFCIEYTNLSQTDNTQDDVFRKYYYNAFMDLPSPIVSAWDPKKYSLALSRSLDASLTQLQKYWDNGTIVSCDTKGWGNDYAKEKRRPPQLTGKQRARAHEDGLMDFRINTAKIRSMIVECQQRGIKVFIVSLPQSKSYSDHLNQKKLKAIFETCRSFETTFSANTHYLNLFNDPRFQDSDFYDADHLNDSGAEKCSKIVNNFINEND